MEKYDYVIVGAGLFGAVFARQMTDRGFRCLVLERRTHVGGNCHTETREGIRVHVYGPHIFHTDREEVWAYVRRFCTFNHFVNRPKVFYRGKIFSFPINLMTLYQLWGVSTPREAEEALARKRIRLDREPANLEEWVLSQVGREIYEIFIRGYTEKQWMRSPRELPASIVQRVPIRLNFDDNYYSHPYQGIPVNGYTDMVRKMLEGIEVRLNTDFFDARDYWLKQGRKVVYTGRIDEFFDFRLGELAYRTLDFRTRFLPDIEDYQGNAVINYTDREIPFTRVIEHKHFDFRQAPHTIVTEEYPVAWRKDLIPYYPVNDRRNNEIYRRYREMAREHGRLILGGRLAEFRYYDMDQVIHAALKAAEKEAPVERMPIPVRGRAQPLRKRRAHGAWK